MFFFPRARGFIPSLFAMVTDMLTTTQYQLPPKPGRLSRTFDAAGQPAIIGGAERGLHVSTNMDVPDDVQLFTNIALVLY